jgi:hypothetical protein
MHLPADDEVQIIKIMEKQLGQIEVFYEKKTKIHRKRTRTMIFFLTRTNNHCSSIKAFQTINCN